jgi:hypothetical protein
MEIFIGVLWFVFCICVIENSYRISKTNKKILEELKEIKYRMRG